MKENNYKTKKYYKTKNKLKNKKAKEIIKEKQNKENRKKQKILWITPNFREKKAWMISSYNFALALADLGYEVYVLTSKTDESKKFEIMKNHYNQENIKIIRSKSIYIKDPFNYALSYGMFKDLRRLLKKHKFKAIIVNKYMFFSSLSVFYLRLKGIKPIVMTDTFPGISWFTKSKFASFLMKVYARTLGILILKLGKIVVLLHENLIKTAKKLKLKYVVIHNGVFYDIIKKIKPANDLIEFKKKNKKPLISFIGRLDGVKGYDIFIEIAKRFKNDFNFVMILGNKDSEKRKELAKKYKFINFQGFRDDIYAVLKASDINILCSYDEGLPNSIMEAMASKNLVIATKVGGVPLLIKDKETGYLITPPNISKEKTINEICNVLNNIKNNFNSKEIKRIIKNAENHIKNNFNLKLSAKQIEKYF